MVKRESMDGMVKMSKGKRGTPAPAPTPAKRIVAPTAEQQAKADYVRGSQDTQHGQSTSVAFRRQPAFETLAKDKRSGIGRDDLLALRFYRDKHEESAMSLTRCALDVQARGGGLPSCLPPGLDADGTLKALEAAMGAVVDVVRAVALEDCSYSDIAIARWGSRRQSWIEQEASRARTKSGRKMAYVERIVPKSGRHRERIREEFLLGLRRLTTAHMLVASTAANDQHKGRLREPSLAELTQPGEATEAPTPAAAKAQPSVDPRYLDEAGHMLPWDDIAAIIRVQVADDQGTEG